MTRIETHLRNSTAQFGDKVALVTAERWLTYAEFDDLSGRLAASLIERGIAKGDRVLVFMENVWEAAVAIFAVWKAGAVVCPINASTKSGRLSFIIGNCEPKAIIVQAKFARVAAEALSATPVECVVATAPNPALPEALDLADCLSARPAPPGAFSDDDLAMIIYTSGSTGEPKGVMMAHRNMDAAISSITSYLKNNRDDVILNVLPISFGYGLYQLLSMVRVGGTTVLEKSFAFPQAIFERIRDERATGFPLAPPMAAMMLQMQDLDLSLFASLRYMTNAAAAMPVAHIRKLRELLPAVSFYSMYGQTECVRATWLPPEEVDQHPGSVGFAIPGMEAVVVDEAGAPVAPDVTGELVLSGPNVMQGYWRNPEATARALRTDPLTGKLRLHTGDLFKADAKGFLTFVARADDIIKSRGEKVAPKEVEAVLYDLPGVAEALVIGVPDSILGSAVKALVVASNPALTERDVIRHCARNLEDFMVPKSVEFRTSLPKTDTGKLSRRLAAES